MNRLRTWKILASIALALTLVACGGKEESIGSAPSSLEAYTVLSDSYKELSTIQAEAASFPSNVSVDIPSTAQLQVGNVVVVKGVAVKLTGIESSMLNGMTRYSFSTPQLNDIFKKIVLNGDISIGTTTSSSLTEQTARPLSQARLAISDKISCGLLSLNGVKCSIDYSPPSISFASFSGSIGITGKLNLQQWDVIDNTGSGKIDIGYDIDASASLKKKTPSLLAKDDACTSTRDVVVGTRARLFTIILPTTLPSVSIRIPICLAADAQAGVIGKILQFKHKGSFQITVGNNSLPTVATPPITGSPTAKASDEETWSFENIDSSLAVVPVDVSASVSLTPEVSIEIAAGLANHPKVTIAALGLVSKLTGSGKISGNFAWVENFGKTIADITGDPLYCLKIGVAVDYQLTTHATLPAFSAFLGKDISASKDIFATPWPIWKAEAPIGKCDLKVDAETILTLASTSDTNITFLIKVIKNDPKAGRIWDDKKPSGIVNITDPSGTNLCTITLNDGQGVCSYTFPNGPISPNIIANYQGDEHFRKSDRSQVNIENEPFTKISSAGIDLPKDATSWSCIRHNATGLLWEAQVNRLAPPHQCEHAKTEICTGYTNYETGAPYDASTVPSTVDTLCGKTGWRLPTKSEAAMLVSAATYSGQTLLLGLDYLAWYGWTSSPGDDPYDAWVIEFSSGTISQHDRGRLGDTVNMNVRLVR